MPDQKANEEFEKLKDEFIAQVSHQFRTPVTKLKSFVDGLVDGAINPTDKDVFERYLKIARASIDILTSAIDSVFDSDYLKTQASLPRKESIDIHFLINRALDKFKNQIKNKNIEIDINVQKTAGLLFADLTILTDIFSKVLDTFIYTVNDSAKIKINCTEDIKKESWIFAISSLDIDIDKSLKEKLLEKFTSPNVTKGEMGLNFYNAYKLVRTHGGIVDIKDDIGFSFIFEIPNHLDKNFIKDILNSEIERASRLHMCFSILEISWSRNLLENNDNLPSRFKVLKNIIRYPRDQLIEIADDTFLVFFRDVTSEDAEMALNRVKNNLDILPDYIKIIWNYPEEGLSVSEFIAQIDEVSFLNKYLTKSEK
ncbi:MAG: HAMP domain-containing sensor histidine kinase [Pseudomonadota bacterium]